MTHFGNELISWAHTSDAVDLVLLFWLLTCHCVIVVTQVKLWSLLSPQGVDYTGDVYRATYTAFRCSRVSGTLGAHEKMQVGT